MNAGWLATSALLTLWIGACLGAEEPGKAEASPPVSAPAKTVYYIPMEGMIDNGLFRSLQRRVDEAEKNGADLVIFEIDTYGGLVAPALDICDLIAGIKKAKSVAYIPKKAISAGALIAVACNEIVMGPLSELGDCEPIIPSTEKGMITAPEKTQTKLRATFRKFAERNGYPVVLAEAMVTKELEVYRVETPSGVEYMDAERLKELKEKSRRKRIEANLVVKKGQLLTMTHNEALEYGFAKKVVEDKDELFKFYDVDAASVVTLPINWAEEMVRFIDMIAPILIAVGLMAIYMELKMPGFGVPGVVAIVCFVLVFGSKYVTGLAGEWEILLFLGGVVLLTAEIFLIPGFGVAGITGIILILLGLVLAFQPVVVPTTPFEYEFMTRNLAKVLASVVLALVGMCLLARYLPEVPVFRRIVLATREKSDEGFVVESAQTMQNLVGKEGVALTKLRPAGRAEIDGQVVNVLTEGDFVPEGKKIVVLHVKGNSVVVREA